MPDVVAGPYEQTFKIRTMTVRLCMLWLLALPVVAQSIPWQQQLLYDLQVLSADSMEGRQRATVGSQRAQRYLSQRIHQIGLSAFDGSITQAFRYKAKHGTNILAYLPGQSYYCIVVSAHYDHLGIRNGHIYNGADDNASGVAALLQVAQALQQQPNRQYTWIFAFFDGEEEGLLGAHAFVANPPVPLEHIKLNLNFDMLSRSKHNELYVCGTRHYPQLKTHLQAVSPADSLYLRLGHDQPNTGRNDWTNASDHYAFHLQQIPFLYFGVEDHADYHRPTDDYQNIDTAFYIHVVDFLMRFCIYLDKQPPSTFFSSKP